MFCNEFCLPQADKELLNLSATQAILMSRNQLQNVSSSLMGVKLGF